MNTPPTSQSLHQTNPTMTDIPSSTSSTQTNRYHRFVVIVGAGASGIVQAGELLRSKTLPHEEFVLLDRYPEFGGCWWKNTYPGCACDTPTHVYQVSWWKNPSELSLAHGPLSLDYHNYWGVSGGTRETRMEKGGIWHKL